MQRGPHLLGREGGNGGGHSPVAQQEQRPTEPRPGGSHRSWLLPASGCAAIEASALEVRDGHGGLEVFEGVAVEDSEEGG